MMCKQVEQLLPLFAGHDLDAKRARMVRAHLQSCAPCSTMAREFRETLEWSRDLTPPLFGEDAYAAIRQRVLREVEAKPTASFSQTIFSLFQPRINWAVASAVIVAVIAIALYVVASRRTGSGEIANKQPEGVQRVEDRRSTGRNEEKQTNRGSSSDTNHAVVNKERRRRNSNFHRGNRSVAAPTIVENSSTAAVSHPIRVVEYDPANPEKELRMEIQTSDPNIRIIWFSPQEPKSVVPNRKGT